MHTATESQNLRGIKMKFVLRCQNCMSSWDFYFSMHVIEQMRDHIEHEHHLDYTVNVRDFKPDVKGS